MVAVFASLCQFNAVTAAVPALALRMVAPAKMALVLLLMVTVSANVVAGVIVTAPVETLPIAIVPVPFALRLTFAANPEDTTEIATVPAATAPTTFNPAACNAVELSTKNAGFVDPASPTANAFADADVTTTGTGILEKKFVTVIASSDPCAFCVESEMSTAGRTSPAANPVKRVNEKTPVAATNQISMYSNSYS